MPSGVQISKLSFLDWEPLCLDLAPGEVVGISGPSGSGKSLLLRAMADLDVHDGDVSLDGERCSMMPAAAWRRKVGMLPAESRWWFATVGEHFCSRDVAVGIVERLGFEAEVFDWEVARLSVGERQRLALARLFDRGSQVLLLDEPTANLDAEATRAVERVVLDAGLTVLWVSHDEAQLSRVAGRRFRMADKKLTEVGA